MRHLAFIIASFFFVAGCNRENNRSVVAVNYDYNGFRLDTLTSSIDQKIFTSTIDSLDQPLDYYEALLGSKEFQNMFEHSRLYINNVIKYLADSSKTKRGKIIAMMTMQRKDYLKNLNFLYACDYLFKKNVIDEKILAEMLFPRLDPENRDIIKNYNDGQVRDVLNDIKNNPKTTSGF